MAAGKTNRGEHLGFLTIPYKQTNISKRNREEQYQPTLNSVAPRADALMDSLGGS